MQRHSLSQYQIDAFAARPFEGNPAAVCPLDDWLPDDLMQSIAAENNLSETAFFVPEADGYRIRWFTPTTEVDLCGHATLATAWVLFNRLRHDGGLIRFRSRSGPVSVRRDGDKLVLDFPAQPPAPCPVPPALVESLQKTPDACFRHDDYVLVYDDESFVRGVTPDLARLAEVECRGVIITSPSASYDFVARFFGPRAGVPEDPVTGSAFTQLAPVWAERLGKTAFSARQVSARGGDVDCELRGDRVLIAGTAVCVLEGRLSV
ncbi:MAG: PhzF family phenazine biosynthesis protein [Pseudomonadota bacterium]